MKKEKIVSQGALEVMVIDIEFYLKTFLCGRACMKFCVAHATLFIDTFKERPYYNNACEIDKHQFRQALLSCDSSCFKLH